MSIDLTEKVAYAIFREHDIHGVDFDGKPREVSLKAARAAIALMDETLSDLRRDLRLDQFEGGLMVIDLEKCKAVTWAASRDDLAEMLNDEDEDQGETNG